MLHSRLRPLPRRNPATPATIPAAPAPAPDLKDQDPDPELSDDDPEDLFGAFLPHLFPDDAPSFHGDPGQHLLYSSPRYGQLEIMVPSYPAGTGKRTEEVAAGLEKDENGVNRVDEGRKLFAHFLWSAAMVVAENVELAETSDTEALNSDTDYQFDSGDLHEAREIWGVRGERVLELGAGAALPSLICSLANASAVTATDHPSSPALTGAIHFNMARNLRDTSSAHAAPKTNTQISINPHEWGNLSDTFATENKERFTRIIAADCYWMLSQHENLCKTMQWFLAPGGKVWVVAGFHTGRAIVASFFETALENGFIIDRIWERDLISRDEHGKEIRRDWVPVREGEGPENRRRWCVVAVLQRA